MILTEKCKIMSSIIFRRNKNVYNNQLKIAIKRANRKLKIESLEERTLLTVVIDSITYDADASGNGWSYTAADTTLVLNGYAGGRIEATAQSLILQLAQNSVNTIRVSDGFGALVVDGDLTVSMVSTDTVSGTLEITVDNYVNSNESNGIDATGDVTIENISSLSVVISDANAALVVGGDLNVTNNGTVTLTVAASGNENNDGCVVAGNVTVTGTGNYVNSGGFYVAGALTQAAGSTAALSTFGLTVDYLVSTWDELLAAFNTTTGVNSSSRQGTESTILLTGALGTGGAVTHEITVSSTLALNNANTLATTVNLIASGNAVLSRASTLTSGPLLRIGANGIANQLNVMAMGVSGGMGSSSLTFAGGALWTSATSGAPAVASISTASGVSTLDTTAGTVDTAAGGIASTASLIYVAGSLSVYGDVILSDNANTNWINSTNANSNQAGGVFVYGTGVGSQTNPDASGNALLTIDGGLIKNCSGQYGGGVENYGTFRFISGTISDCAANVNLNTYANEGGGIFNSCNLIMTGGLIESCIACGGFYNSSNTSGMTNVYGKGGGIHNSTSGVGLISGGQITSNTSGWAGGGIYAGGLGTSTLLITGGMIDHNLASIGGGIYMNAAVEIDGGQIANNTIANNTNPNGQTGIPSNRYGYGYGIFVEYYNNSSSLYPTLIVGGATVVNTNNDVFIATIQVGSTYFQPIVIDSELTAPGPVMYVTLGFDPTTTQLANHQTLFARYENTAIPVNPSKFLLGYGPSLTTLYRPAFYSTGGVNYLEIDLASTSYQARVNQYYFTTFAAAVDYVNTTYNNNTAVTLYLIDNVIMTETLSFSANVDVTLASETAASQAAALELYTQFIDYDTKAAVAAQNAYGDYTVMLARNISVASGVNGILTVSADAALTLGDGDSYVYYNGNFVYPVDAAGIYVEGASGSLAAGTLTVQNNAAIQNHTNETTASGYETGGVTVAGTMTLNGGSVTNNVGMVAGGIRVLSGGELTINGGSITANLGGPAGTWGEPVSYTGAGGIEIDSGGTATISATATSAWIAENHGAYGAIENNGTLTMLAGTIRDNLAASALSTVLGGVYQNGTMNIGQSALIYSDPNTTNGIYLTSGQIVTVSAALNGGNSASIPLYLDSATTASGTALIQTSYNGPIDQDLDNAANEVDSAYDLLRSGIFVHAQGAWIVQGTNSLVTNAGKITDDQLTRQLVIGNAVIAYDANAPSGTTATGSTTDPAGSTGYNGNTVVALQSNGFAITGTTDQYQFLAWNTRADASGVWYYPYGSVGDRLTTVADVTLYAVWSSANVIVVNTLSDSTAADDYTSLREAIITANSVTTTPAVPIYIEFETTLTAWEQSWDNLTTGLFALTTSLPALANPIVISTTAFYTATGKSLAIDGGGDYRLLTITGGTAALPVWVTGLTLQNGGGLDPTNSASSAHGGAVYLANGAIAQFDAVTLTDNSANLATLAKASGGAVFNRGTLMLTDCVVTQSAGTAASGNNAYYGGGIYNTGTLTMNGKTVSYCGALASGGGVYNAGSATIFSCDFISNRSGNNGGALCNVSTSTALGTLTASAVRLTDNTATGYGGGLCNTGTATLTSVSATGNTSAKNGGGICNSYYTISGVGTSSMILTECTISQNSAVYGGGILNGSTMNIYGCTIASNTASENGGGISNTNGTESTGTQTVSATLTLGDSAAGTATTVTGNSAIYGAGIGQWGVSMAISGATSITGNGSGTTLNGGGVYVYDSTNVTIASSVTVTGNTPNNVFYANSASAVTLLAALFEDDLFEKTIAAEQAPVQAQASATDEALLYIIESPETEWTNQDNKNNMGKIGCKPIKNRGPRTKEMHHQTESRGSIRKISEMGDYRSATIEIFDKIGLFDKSGQKRKADKKGYEYVRTGDGFGFQWIDVIHAPKKSQHCTNR